MKIRPPAVADMFYTGNGEHLAVQVSDFMDVEQDNPLRPKAIIVPHAGFVYSGTTAGHGYALVKKMASVIKKIVLIGPCHRVWIQGMAIPSCEYFETPLGKVEVDTKKLNDLAIFPQVVISDQAHEQEHSLEVQLPFLQPIFPQFQLTPIVVGDISTGAFVEVLEYLWGGEETLIVISSDLSHFLDYNAAIEVDSKTSQLIENFDPESISSDMACGSAGIKALLKVARNKKLHVKTIHQCNSGDTAGDKDRVVGYGTYAVY